MARIRCPTQHTINKLSSKINGLGEPGDGKSLRFFGVGAKPSPCVIEKLPKPKQKDTGNNVRLAAARPGSRARS